MVQLTSALAASACLLAAIASAAPTKQAYGVGAAGYKGVTKASKALNIVLNNDDSWASANLRAFYYALRTAGHNVQVVAPAHGQSGTGGTIVLPKNQTLVTPGEFGALPASAPYSGRNETDHGLAYFDGTPAACTFWALDQVQPFNTTGGIDLLVSGPNFGPNLGPLLFTLSGTIGATYAAVERGVPAIAFSASNKARGYQELNINDPNDESNLIAVASTNFVTDFASRGLHKRSYTPQNQGRGKSDKRILPYAIGLNVNYSPLNASSCPKPEWVHTRLTGGALTDKLIVGPNGLPNYVDFSPKDGLNTCINGDCSLPGETSVVAKGCKASVSIYSTDYDAPKSSSSKVHDQLDTAIKALNHGHK
ncbi:unnamed protein product [Parajaminaea phylloscopi]